MPVVAAIAVAVLFTGGCSSAQGTPLAGDPSESATGVSESPSPSPTPSITPPYPTEASGCHDNKGWTTEESVDWAGRFIDTPKENYGGDSLSVVSLPGYNGPLCRKITVQVEFWKLVYGVADDADRDRLEDGTQPAYYFDIRRVKRVELHVDARVEQEIALPASLYATDRSPCVGALLSVTVGKPLTSRELPKEVRVGGEQDFSGRAVVDFRSKRVADYELSQPSAPQVCSPDGKPTADPADVPAPGSQPTDLHPPDLWPSPTHSFDLDDIFASPTP
ncbi:hypothetical protein ACKI1I_04300 [Streptomyces turgidiscabies]|uniref:Lipoprotein n=1 Tax=Streptomyces turgidiscabies (strain Car8) TaxID=698760 RepID=L7FA94_STRT8|nr:MULTISPECIES: hypothetical protein [Streptomyces]ELP68523.1 hypothetical protein STRTUCAR8_03595 [Streptomyces turgidiscabies Car8]MDX3494068.1 hypothetical protein [Streptomyces turgidiscabies]